MKKLSLIFILILWVTQSLFSQQREWKVAIDGSGDFTSINEAIAALPDQAQQPVVIRIFPGTYQEKVVVPSWKTNVHFIGEDAATAIISWDDYSGKGNLTTFTSYTVLVQGKGFRAENITFQNTAGPVGQAVAMHAEGDEMVFVNCRFLGDQDTLYVGVANSRQYYHNCYIEGTTDFIFGPATAWFEDCTIHSKKNSYITAASTPEGQDFGFVFRNCTLTANEVATKVYLGRPWRPFAKTVFIQCQLGNHILPEGWHNWNKPEAEKTTFYAEYQSQGPGATIDKRVAWSHQLTKKQAKIYHPKIVLGEWLQY
jgi:pectinesterase